MAERFLTFRGNGQLYALAAEQVAEVIRLPALARVPQAPRGLLGLANTLAMSVVQRYREIGILRSVGTTPRQIVSFVRPV